MCILIYAGTVPAPPGQPGGFFKLVGELMVSKAQKRAAKMAAQQAKTQTAAPANEPTTPAPSTPATDGASPPAPATTPKVVTKVVGTLKVKDGLSFRGARQAWYDVLKAHDGKPAQEYLDATTKKAPSLPRSGKQEPSSGWLRWFVRHEVATIVPEKPEAKA